MKFLNLIRYNDWWSYKVPPLLGLAYFIINFSSYTFSILSVELLRVLFYIIVAASYVSIINDYCDIEEDKVAGKKNNFISMSQTKGTLILISIFIMISIINYLIYPNITANIFYIFTLLTYSLYSFPPVRLKIKGIWGLLSDASGAHLFISLFVVSYFKHYTQNSLVINTSFLGCLVLFLYGIRGIVWHQFMDKTNDSLSGTNTFATKSDEHKISKVIKMIFFIELMSILLFVILIAPFVTKIALTIYLLLLAYKYYINKQELVIAISNQEKYHFLFSDFYEFYFPISLIISITINQNFLFSIILIIHLFMFPLKLKILIQDISDMIKRIFNYHKIQIEK